ncbi:MAG: hypothetical protein KJ666_03660 [Bacteroidetes bacterium]|nr:hypothetical protein [Bacteroidota bacterium]MBU2585868.1 hypothetical protein [Bacteroidota bacterium]
MKLIHLIKYFTVLIVTSIFFSACYTMISHPKVSKKENSNDYVTHRVSIIDDCLSCHSEQELREFNSYHQYYYQSENIYRPERTFIYYDPYYSYPWWYDIKATTTYESPSSSKPSRSYDGSLRNNDGGRSRENNTNINLPPPSRNEDSNRGTSSVKTDSSSDRKSDSNSNTRDRESQSPKTRENSGERKK